MPWTRLNTQSSKKTSTRISLSPRGHIGISADIADEIGEHVEVLVSTTPKMIGLKPTSRKERTHAVYRQHENGSARIVTGATLLDFGIDPEEEAGKYTAELRDGIWVIELDTE